MIKTLCVVFLALGLASCSCDSEAKGGCGDCSSCSGCESMESKDGAGAAEEAKDAKDAMTPPPSDAKQPADGK